MDLGIENIFLYSVFLYGVSTVVNVCNIFYNKAKGLDPMLIVLVIDNSLCFLKFYLTAVSYQMRSVTCISFLLLLLGGHPANTMRYHSLENTLGQNYTHLLLDTNLTVLNPSSLIQSRDFTEIFVWDSDTIFVGAANYLLKINADFVIDRT